MKRNEVIVHEHKKGVRAVKYNQKPQGHIEPPKPRNPVAKNAGAAIGGGAAGAHKDAKKASQAVRGQKHKKAELAEMDSQGYTGSRDDYKLGDPEGTGKAMKAKEFAKKALDILNKQDDDGEEWYDREGRPNPKGAYDAGGHYHLDRDVEEMYGRKSSYYNPMDYERDQQRQMDYDRRSFKRAELQHELGHEDDPDFERKMRQQAMDRDRGPWYLKIDGKIYKSKGMPKSFDWKSGATKYGQAILKNRPELAGKIFLTKKSEDGVAEGEGKVTASDPTKGVEITNPETGVKTTIPPKMSAALAPDAKNPGRYTLNPQAVQPGSDSDEQGTGPKVGSQVSIPDQATEEDMMVPPNDSTSPIHGGEDHDEVSKLLVLKLKRLAGL